jgi:hypothetical protein
MFIGMLRLTGQRMTAGLETEARVSLETADIFFTTQRSVIHMYIYIYIYIHFLMLRMTVIKIIYIKLKS